MLLPRPPISGWPDGRTRAAERRGTSERRVLTPRWPSRWRCQVTAPVTNTWGSVDGNKAAIRGVLGSPAAGGGGGAGLRRPATSATPRPPKLDDERPTVAVLGEFNHGSRPSSTPPGRGGHADRHHADHGRARARHARPRATPTSSARRAAARPSPAPAHRLLTVDGGPSAERSGGKGRATGPGATFHHIEMTQPAALLEDHLHHRRHTRASTTSTSSGPRSPTATCPGPTPRLPARCDRQILTASERAVPRGADPALDAGIGCSSWWPRPISSTRRSWRRRWPSRRKHLAAIVPEPAIFPVSAKRALAGDPGPGPAGRLRRGCGCAVEKHGESCCSITRWPTPRALRLRAPEPGHSPARRWSCRSRAEQRIGRAHERLRTGKKVLETAAATVRAETAALKARVRQDLADFTAELRTAVPADIDAVDAAGHPALPVASSFRTPEVPGPRRRGADCRRSWRSWPRRVIEVANENVREVLDDVTAELGPARHEGRRSRSTRLKIRRLDLRAGRPRHHGVPVRRRAGRRRARRWRPDPGLRAARQGRRRGEGRGQGAGAAGGRWVAALVGPKLDEIIDGFGARLLEFVAQAGDTLTRGISEVLDRALRDRRAADATVSAKPDAAGDRRRALRAPRASTSGSPRSARRSGTPETA